jgi:hypothetical protein
MSAVEEHRELARMANRMCLRDRAGTLFVATSRIRNKSDPLSQRFERFHRAALIGSLLLALENVLDQPHIVRGIDYLAKESSLSAEDIRAADYEELLRDYIRPYFEDLRTFLAAVKQASFYPLVKNKAGLLEKRVQTLSCASEQALL